jgi:hypothetical protein
VDLDIGNDSLPRNSRAPHQPLNHSSDCEGIRIHETEGRVGFASFGPVQDDAGDEEGVPDQSRELTLCTVNCRGNPLAAFLPISPRAPHPCSLSASDGAIEDSLPLFGR